MSAVCPTHQVAWVIQPAGVSRSTGKPYNSFIKCPIAGCRMRPGADSQTAPQASQVALGGPISPVPAMTHKDREIRYAVCLKFAGEIYHGLGTDAVGDALALAAKAFEFWPVED